MSGHSRSAGMSGEKDTVDTTYFGTPIGSARAQSNARSVPMVPPSAIIPSTCPSACSRAVRVAAPRAMICIAWFSSPLSTAFRIDAPAASATRCLDMSTGRPGSPRTLTSMLSTRPPWFLMTPET